MAETTKSKISPFTIDRLAMYLRVLNRLKESNIDSIFSHELSKHLGASANIIRKDLSRFGQFGRINAGYNVDKLIESISSILNVDRSQDVIVVGAGNLGRALLGFKGFETYQFNIQAIFDTDEKKINTTITNVPCYHIDELESFVKKSKIKFAIITVPAHAAPFVAESLVKAGINGILNFAPIILKVPNSVKLIEIDVISMLRVLSYYVKNSGKK